MDLLLKDSFILLEILILNYFLLLKQLQKIYYLLFFNMHKISQLSKKGLVFISYHVEQSRNMTGNKIFLNSYFFIIINLLLLFPANIDGYQQQQYGRHP